MHLETLDQEFERRLRAALYRFDCPRPETIGEYAIDVLVDPDRRQLAEHVLGCHNCAEELHILREFVANDPPVRNTFRNWRRALATLLTPVPPLATSALRGNARGSSCEYRAGPIGVVLGTVAAGRRGTVSVDGLLLHDTRPDAVVGCDVTLFMGHVAVHTTRTDDLGNFAFESIAIGSYTLVIECAAESVAIEHLSLR